MISDSSPASQLQAGLISFFRFKFNMSALMALAVIGAILTGNWAGRRYGRNVFEISEGSSSSAARRAAAL